VPLEVGDSFTLRNVNGVHLHVLVAESSSDDSAFVILVYLSTAETFRDPTILIRIGEHPFVVRDCWVKYRNLIICSRNEIAQRIVQYYGQVDAHLLTRIQVGIERSDYVSRRDRQQFIEWRDDRVFRTLGF